MTKSNVTVLIPTYNRAHFLAECLDSVLGQTAPPAQVIVINDGSTDNTREVLAPYTNRIEYIEKENGGKSTALNLALPRVRGDYVWIMDDDDVALPDALETHLAVLENDPGIGFTYTPGYIGKTGPDGKGIQIVSLSPLPEVSQDEFIVRFLQGCFFFHDAMVTRTSCYEAVGRFDTTFIRCQDVEMRLRLARHFRGRPIDKPTIVVRNHSGGRTNEEHWLTLYRKFLEEFSHDSRAREVITDRILREEAEIFTRRGKESLASGDHREARERFEKARVLVTKTLLQRRFCRLEPRVLMWISRELKLCLILTALRFAPSLTVAALRRRAHSRGVTSR